MRISSFNYNKAIKISLNNGNWFLISYETCVAAKINGKEYRTETFHSRSTEMHIYQFTSTDAEKKPQSFFDDLM